MRQQLPSTNSVSMKYPIGLQDFASIRNNDFVYVDKTKHIYNLANNGKYYFLSRPRRFGKSLLISTLEAYFSGKRELFHHLYVEAVEQKWDKYPIFHLDLNTENYSTPESLTYRLEKNLSTWEALYGSDNSEKTSSLRFEGIIRRAYEKTGRGVVILVDEYDKPMVQAIDNEELQEEYRNTLKAFYSVMKTQDRYIRFALLTGVSKFSKVSIFSDLNNLDDISMDHRYADICGMTDDEIHRYFDNEIHVLAQENNLTVADAYDKLKRLYDGYRFLNEGPRLYNPFSLLQTLSKKRFGDYWFETGTPSFLVKLLKETNYKLDDLTRDEQTADMLNSIDSYRNNPIPLIYQSGYLTIKDYDEEFKMYKLGFPNKEVESGFINYLLPFYLPKEKKENTTFIRTLVRNIETGDVEGFMERLSDLFLDGDYQVMGKMELYFQNVMFVIFRVLGFFVEVERRTYKGRIDMVVKTKNYVYIIELKLDGTVEEALQQIRDNDYIAPYRHDSRQKILLAINFSSTTKTINDWKKSVEE